jgi:hypothetical protein
MSFSLGSGVRLRGIVGLALASVLVLVLLVSAQSFAQSPYAPNVMVHATTTVPLFGGGAFVDDSATTGMNVTVSGLTDVSGSIVVTTETLNAPSANVPAVSSSGNAFYFDVNIVLPAGASAPAGSSATIILSNPMITSGYTLEYWAGSAWLPASYVAVSGTTMEGDVPVSSLGGTNLAAVEAPSTGKSSGPPVAPPVSVSITSSTNTSNTSTPLPTMSVELLAVVAAAVVIVISAVVLTLALMRGRAEAKEEAPEPPV